MKLGKTTKDRVFDNVGELWLILFNNRSPIYDINFYIYGEPLLNYAEKIEKIDKN